MAIHDDLGDRMKKYENVPKVKLKTKTPVIIRIDGKNFHNYTKGFNRPFDDVLSRAMDETMKRLCEEITGCVLAMHESDEISLLLIDYQNPNRQAWYDYRVQKMCSIGSSMATWYFNKAFQAVVDDFYYDDTYKKGIFPCYWKSIKKGAMFDCRCFNLPQDEVTNYFYWRQLDTMRNSIQMVGRAVFSHKALQNKSCSDIKEMLKENGIDFDNDCQKKYSRGTYCIREEYQLITERGEATRHRWVIDENAPLFKGEGRKYIDRFVYVGE